MNRLWARYALHASLSEEDRAALRSLQAEEFDARFLRAARLGAGASLLTSLGCAFALPAAWAQWGLFAGGALSAALLAAPSFARRWKHPLLLPAWNIGVGIVAATLIGEAASMATGLSSAGMLVLILFWMFGTVVVPMSPKHLALAVGAQTACYSAPALLTASPEGLGLFLVVTGGAGMVFVAGALERQRIQARRLLARRRAEETNAHIAERTELLATRTEELESRVNVQFQQVLTARRRVEALQRAVEETSQPLSTAPRLRVTPELLGLVAPGQILGGRARILRAIASGGFGDVYVAEDLATGVEVIAKVMRCDDNTSAARKKRFVLEAAAASRVSHPGIVRVLHVDISAEGWPFLLCERIDGVTLRWCLQARALTRAHYLAAVMATSDALSAVHAAGIVHRDVKPDNLMLHAASPGLKVLDFGISRWSDSDEHDLTGAGELLGTVAYMSPEQVRDGEQVGTAADVYALGLTLFECLAGEHPLAGLPAPKMLRAHAAGAIPSLRERCVDPDDRAVALVDAMLRRDASTRPSVTEVRRRLSDLVPIGVTAVDAYESRHLAHQRAARTIGDQTNVTTQDAPRADTVPTP